MLHELVVALRGHPGHIFTEKNGGMVVNSALPFFHPCEVAIMNQLLTVAADYRSLTTFIESHRHVSLTHPDDEGLKGMYIEAVCEGLDHALDPYRKVLVLLEKEILVEPSTPLSMLQHRLMPHSPILRSLVKIVNKLESERPQGCMVLDTIYKAAASGVAGVGDALKLVLAEGHKVLYKQLLAWLLQGSLYDPHQEFFIVRDDSADDSILLGEDGETSRSKSKTYKLLPEMVPAHISPHLAEKIYFIGESIQLFESDRRVEVQGAVLRERETEFYQQLVELRDKETFVISDFAEFVDRIRETVSSHLHHLVMKQAGLLAELTTLWEVFLLGRGELFHALIKGADRRLAPPPTTSTQHDVNQVWITSARAVLPQHEEEGLIAKVKLVVGTSLSPGWEQLTLQYAVPWPLHLVVTPACLERYNQVFQFLLLVRRTQTALHQLWAEAMADRRNKKKNLGTIWQVRCNMTFLVDNLQYYLMADVLDTQISSLNNKLKASNSFEEIKRDHELFLNTVSSHIFLHNQPVMRCLKELLSICLQFCTAATLPTDGQSQPEELLHHLSTSFSRQSSLLLQLLTSLRHHLTGSHLAQLLLRIDYNRYFSKQGHKIEATAATT